MLGNPEKLKKYLTKKNIEKRERHMKEEKEKIQNVFTKYIKKTRKNPKLENAKMEREWKRSFNPLYYYEKSGFDTENLLKKYLKPFHNKLNSTGEDFERYLRSLQREGEEKYLPYQGPLVGNLFGNQSNV